MPFLRMIRDKRGYETTYLIHSVREGPRQRSRILYVFRTPGGAYGGRLPFEPETRQHLELSHPTIAFDWKAIMADRQVVDDGPDARRGRRSRRSEEARPAAAASSKPSAAPAPTPPRPSIPSKIEGSTPNARMEFLALWYPILRDRIPERTSDPTRRETLLALAERLNPTAWTDADEIAAGLQGAAEALDHLSRVFSKRRRRSRRSTKRPAESEATANMRQAPPSTGPPASTELPATNEPTPGTRTTEEAPAVVATGSHSENE